MEFETVIGLETHIQLATKSKIFCSSSASFGGEPNEYIDPVTLGLPGALPVLNKRVVEYALMLGLATKCEIRRLNSFARKHYFYPDLPKGYQISQFDEPICERGRIPLLANGINREIGIKRIHMEEDAGKNIHDKTARVSLIDLNRAGVPLVEMVSEPDLRSPMEAGLYLKTIRQLVRYLGISDGNMEEGSLRCDANISLRPVGSTKLGTRTEIKDLNSFKFVEQALEYEVARQTALLRNGQSVIQETLLFENETGRTRPMRSKEESADYRYFPDPDLPPLRIDDSWVRSIHSSMPKLPWERRQELISLHGLSSYDADILSQERAYLDFFESILKVCHNAKAACNWMCSELFGALNRASLSLKESPVTAVGLGKLIVLIDDQTISGKMAKTVFEEMFLHGSDPEAIVNEKGLRQITDDGAIRGAIQEIFTRHTAQLGELLSGKEALFGFFVGQVMKATAGNANPKKVNELLRDELSKRRG